MEPAVQSKSRVHSVLLTGDHGGSTLLPPNVTNEFPEYGTMEESGEGLRTSVEFDAESLPCCPQGQEGVRLLAGPHSGLNSVTAGPKGVGEAPSHSHLTEQRLQPIDSLISALKATEARIASGTLQATTVLDKDAVPSFPVQRLEKELGTASHQTQRASSTLFPAGQEKPPYIPLSAEVTTEGHFHLSIQKDLAVLLTAETQVNPGRKGAVHAQEPVCPAASAGSAAVTHNSVGSAGVLREWRSDLGRARPAGCDQGSSTGRPGRVKHVEFEGVDVLWTGGEKRETRQPVDLETNSTSPESKGLSKVPSHVISSAGLYNSASATESVRGETRRGPSGRLASRSGTFSPVPLIESGEDEVFLQENKEHLEKQSDLDRDKER